MLVSLPYAITYTTQKDVPISIVARNLLAHEVLILDTVDMLTGLYPSLAVEKTTIRVRSVTNNSPLKELIALTMVVSFQDDLVKEVPDLIEKLTGHAVPESIDSLVTLLAVLIVSYAVMEAIQRIYPGKDIAKLKEEYERKIAMVSDRFGMEKADIEEYLEQKYQEEQPKSLLKAISDFILPARLESDVSINTVDDEVLLDPDVVRAIPPVLDAAGDSSDSFPLEATFMEIHRSDRDQNRHGWRAVVPEVSDKKVRLILGDAIKPTDLYGSTSIIGDLAVYKETDSVGELQPKTYHLSRVIRREV